MQKTQRNMIYMQSNTGQGRGKETLSKTEGSKSHATNMRR